MGTVLGVGTPHTTDEYDTDWVETGLLYQKHRVPDLQGGFVAVHDLNAEQIIELLKHFDEHAEKFAHVHMLAMIPKVYELSETIEESTSRNQKNALIWQRQVLQTRIQRMEAHPVLWIRSTPLYLKLLKDLALKAF